MTQDPVPHSDGGGISLSRTSFIGLVAVLGLSLAVNVFILGWFAAQETRPEIAETTEPEMPGPSGVRLGALADTLPKGDRRLLRRSVRDHAPEFRSHAKELRGALRDLRDVLTAERLSESDLNAALDRVAIHTEGMRGQVYSLLRDTAPDMTKEGRKALGWFAMRQIVGGAAGGPPRRLQKLRERLRERFGP